MSLQNVPDPFFGKETPPPGKIDSLNSKKILSGNTVGICDASGSQSARSLRRRASVAVESSGFLRKLEMSRHKKDEMELSSSDEYGAVFEGCTMEEQRIS